MNVPREIQVQFGLSPGSVYLIKKVGDVREHYFVTLNLDPICDDRIILVSATTKHINEENYIANLQYGQDTLVKIVDQECIIIRRESTFNCNRYIDPTIDELKNSVRFERIEYIGIIESFILQKLRQATLRSPRLMKKYRICLDDTLTS